MKKLLIAGMLSLTGLLPDLSFAVDPAEEARTKTNPIQVEFVIRQMALFGPDAIGRIVKTGAVKGTLNDTEEKTRTINAAKKIFFLGIQISF